MKTLIVTVLAAVALLSAAPAPAHAGPGPTLPPNPTPSYTLGYMEMINDGEQGYFDLRAQGVPQILSNMPDHCDLTLQADIAAMTLGTRPWMAINSTDFVAGCNAAVQELVAKGYAR